LPRCRPPHPAQNFGLAHAEETLVKIVACTYAEHAASILEILNDAIVNSTAVYDYVPRPAESMVSWFKAKQDNKYPVVGVESDAGELMGFASYGPFRAWPAYKYSVEHGIYVHKNQRRRGLARQLMQHLIQAARQNDVHVLIGGIDADNSASIALHESLGFVHAGTIRQAGFKFGRWLDLAFYELVLDTPKQPRDG
jgi:phosphinothricin acetyltransferase